MGEQATRTAITAERFIDALRFALPREFDETIPETSGQWSTWMFGNLHAVSARLELRCCCTTPGAHLGTREPNAGEHREYLFDMTWYERWDRWTQPSVILEHENSWDTSAFLFDLWKLTFGYAPLRVAIGYAGPGKTVDDLARDVEEAATSSGWAFPSESEDLVLIAQGGRMKTPRDYVVLHRAKGSATYQHRGALETAAIS